MADTKIDWCDKVWNPVTGCTPAGAGCQHCYAKGVAKRFWGDRPFSEVQCHHDRLYQPLRWRKPSRIFVNSMGDLFHKDVPDEFIARVLAVIRRANQHTFIVLTKRPERMRKFFTKCGDNERTGWITHNGKPTRAFGCDGIIVSDDENWPIRNLILGVSCSNQTEVDRDVPILLATPAACRCVSLEPLLGPVNLTRIEDEESGTWYNALTGQFSGNDTPGAKLDWVIVGGETGPGARPMHPDWVRTVRDQCEAAGTAFFFKQWGEFRPVGAKTDRTIAQYGSHRMSVSGEVFRVRARVDPNVKDGWVLTNRVGKRSAGHLLGGREYRAFPQGGEVKP